MEPVIRISGLTVSFGARPALQDVSATFRAGELSVVIGPSGSGKTTLLRAINRLNELFPGCRSSGEVALRLDGSWIDVHRKEIDLARLRRRAAMVFQHPNVLPVSIRKNLAIPLRLALKAPRREIPERTERALREAGLLEEVADRLDDGALTLSGGQQQRLCLARALALEPQILLLDEPTASLDARATRRIEELLLHIKQRYAIVAVSHSLGQMRRLADVCLVMQEGRVVERIERRELDDPESFRRIVDEAS